jgi:LysR family transcriptional regulator, hypochlorite-specific transcription factor HypT
MHILWLQDFLTVADTGNFTRAAQLRNVSQAAFSRRIKALELWLGAALIDRTSFPARLTADGELFRERAAEIVQQVAETRLSLAGTEVGRRNQIRIALPHSLVTGRLPAWWSAWSKKAGLGVLWSVETGNVHEIVPALVTGNIDLLICYDTVQAPIILPSDRYDRIMIGKERLGPYASTVSVGQKRNVFPGRKGSPLPLLMYSKNAIFAREVDVIIERAPQKLVSRIIFETETAEVLQAMAAADHGVAWLPESVAKRAPPGILERIDSGEWSTTLGIVAYRDKHTGTAAMERLWALLCSGKF